MIKKAFLFCSIILALVVSGCMVMAEPTQGVPSPAEPASLPTWTPVYTAEITINVVDDGHGGFKPDFPDFTGTIVPVETLFQGGDSALVELGERQIAVQMIVVTEDQATVLVRKNRPMSGYLINTVTGFNAPAALKAQDSYFSLSKGRWYLVLFDNFTNETKYQMTVFPASFVPPPTSVPAPAGPNGASL